MEIRYQNFLVPTDFSVLADNALLTAIEMCKRHNANLHLLHVMSTNMVVTSPGAAVAAMSASADFEKIYRQKLLEMADNITHTHNIECAVYNRAGGNIADTICDTAEELNTDMVIMGTHGSSGLKEVFMGSNAFRVVKSACCPVLTIPGHEPIAEFKRILFPVRLVAGALDKYDYIRPIMFINEATLIIAGVAKEKEDKDRTIMQGLLDDIKHKLEADKTDCEAEMYYCDNLAKKVMQIAEEKNADLIVISATINSTLQNLFSGGYTRHIVNHSSIPILSIKAKQEE